MNGTKAIRQELTGMLVTALSRAQELGKLPPVALPEVILERSQNPDHGDYASSLSLKLARAVSLNPLAIARELVALMTPGPEIASIEVAPPGFINFTMKDDWLTGQVVPILTAGDAYGNSNIGEGSKVQIEFVSVNPTGPLHVGHGRGAVMGSTLSNVLSASGYQVEREYYINDAGSQMDAFYGSLYARYLQYFGKEAEMPANGYLGSYMIDLAQEIIAEVGDKFLQLSQSEAVSRLGAIGLERMLLQIKNDLMRMGVSFDTWFSERSLYQNGQYRTVMNLLRQKSYIAEKEGAVWFVSTVLGEDKDNVVIRSDGSPTYFATDIAYHYNKFLERKFDQVINIWGADHQ
ncbi:MAG: arginine--tRNA ligase, partial [Chloroflexota bacterium]